MGYKLMKKEQQQGFPRGPPPLYKPGRTPPSSTERAGYGVIDVVWPFLLATVMAPFPNV